MSSCAKRDRVRGDRLDGSPLNLALVEEIGLLVGDGHAGPFTVAVEWIEVA